MAKAAFHPPTRPRPGEEMAPKVVWQGRTQIVSPVCMSPAGKMTKLAQNRELARSRSAEDWRADSAQEKKNSTIAGQRLLDAFHNGHVGWTAFSGNYPEDAQASNSPSRWDVVGRKPAKDMFGKRKNIIVPEVGDLKSPTSISADTPDWMKTTFQFDQLAMETAALDEYRESSEASDAPAAGLKGGCRISNQTNGPGKRLHVANGLTGRIATKAQVSPASPDWFTSSFDSNREFFAKEGTTKVHKRQSVHEKPIGRRTYIVNEVTGKPANTLIISAESPEWFGNSIEANQPLFDDRGFTSHVRHKPIRRANSLKTAMAMTVTDSPNFITCPLSPTPTSPGGFIQNTVVNTPRDQRGHGLRTMIADMDAREMAFKCNSISPDAPDFMKSPVRSCSAFFDKRTMLPENGQELSTGRTQEPSTNRSRASSLIIG